MLLTDLEPQWLLKDGVRVGFIFKSPANPKFWQSCFLEPGQRRDQWALFAAVVGRENCHQVQGCKPTARWSITPPIAEADFASLSVTPSLDGSPGGLWHGFITNGEIVGGL